MKLPYGLLAGQVVHITEVHSGRTGVQCPYCKKALLAKKGKIKRHHFAHIEASCMADFNNNLFSIQGKLPIHLPLFIFAERQTNTIQNKLDLLNQQYKEIEQQLEAEKKLLPELYQILDKLRAFYLRKQMPIKASQIQDLIQQVTLYTSQKIAAFPAFHRIKGSPFTTKYTDGKNSYTLEELVKGSIAKEYYYPIFFHKYVLYLKNYHNYKTSAPRITKTLLVFQNEWSYFKRFQLYFLEVQTEKGVFHKIGLTSRAIETRLLEIRQDLKIFYQQVELKVIAFMKNHAFLEIFFKQKYSDYQMPIGSLTEYFQFPAPLLSSILLNFELIEKTGLPLRDTLLWTYWAYHKSNKKIYGHRVKSIYVAGQKMVLSEREVSFLKQIVTSTT